MLGKAIAITADVFQGKTDKGGEPYIMHCLRVMNGVKHLGTEVMCIAVMHDLVEDTHYTIDDLRDLGFSQKVCIGVELLTHNPDEMSYDDYIKSLAFHKDIVAIKLSDLRDNSDITRLKGLRKKDFDRMEKYHRAYVYLTEL